MRKVRPARPSPSPAAGRLSVALQEACMPKRQRQEEEAEEGRRAAKLAPQVGKANGSARLISRTTVVSRRTIVIVCHFSEVPPIRLIRLPHLCTGRLVERGMHLVFFGRGALGRGGADLGRVGLSRQVGWPSAGVSPADLPSKVS